MTQFVVDLLDGSNNPIGSGPLENVESVSITERLDEAGAISFTVPSTDAKVATLIDTAVRFRVRLSSGALHYGIIENDTNDVTADAPTRTVNGSDMLRELAHYSMGWWCFFDNKDLNTIVLPALVASTPWSLGTVDAALGNFYYRFDGDSRLSALIKIATNTGKHFRLGSTFRTFDFGALGVSSGLRLTNVDHYRVGLDSNTDIAIIGNLTITGDRGPIVNRIIPWGAGQDGGDTNRAKVSLFHLTPGDSRWANIKVKQGVIGATTTVSAVGDFGSETNNRYTVADTTGFESSPIQQLLWAADPTDLTANVGYDFVTGSIISGSDMTILGSPTIPSPPSVGATLIANPQLYIQDDTAYTADPHEAVIIFTDVTLTDLSLSAFELAASQLYNRAYQYLQTHKVKQDAYAVSVFNCPDTLHAGDTVLIQYRGVVKRDGVTVKWVDLNDTFYVINITRNFAADGSTNAVIEISNIARQTTDTSTAMADAGVQQVAAQVTVGSVSVGSSSGGGGGPGGAGDPITVSSPLVRTINNITINNAAADGTTKGAAAFTAADFDASAGVISLDYTNGQAASGSTKGYLTSGDWTTFNGKLGTSLARGSLFRGSAAGVVEALAKGIAGAVLTGDGTDTAWSTFALSGTAGQTYTFGTAGGTIPTSAGTLTVSTTNAISAAGVITHAITSSSNPGAAASLLASDASGYMQIVHIGVGTAPTATEVIKTDTVSSATAAGSITGVYSIIRGAPAGSSSTTFQGAFLYAESASGNAQTFNRVIGVSGQARHRGSNVMAEIDGLSFIVDNPGGGGVTNATGITIGTNNNSAATIASSYGARSAITQTTAGGQITAAYGVSSEINVIAGTVATWKAYNVATPISTGTVTNAYGLYINAIAVGTTINNAITTLGGTLNFIHNADSIFATFTGHTILAVTNPIVQITRNDSAAGIASMLGLTALGSGANGDGGSILMNGKSSTTAAQPMGLLSWEWINATHASRTAKMTLAAYDTAVRNGITIATDGVAAITSIVAAQQGAYATTAVDLTLTSAHHFVAVTVTAKTITLPTAVGCVGREYVISTVGVTSTVIANGAELIDGFNSWSLSANSTMQIKSDGAGWVII